MANENIGFLDSLGIGSQDEASLLAEQRRLAELENNKGRARNQNIRDQSQAGFAGLFGAIGNLVRPQEGRSRNVKDSLAAGDAASRQVNDQQAAQAAGITVDDLKGRRAVRKAVQNSGIAEDGSYENRIKLAEFAAKSALDNNQTDAAHAALRQVTALRTEKKEFDKLSAVAEQEENEAIESNIPDVFIGGSKTPVAGQLARVSGVNGVLANGQFYGPGEFSFEGPDAGKNDESLDQRYRKIVPSGDRSKMDAMIQTGLSSVRQYKRVLSTIIDLSAKGGVNSVLSTSGNVISWVDNAARNVQGILDPILGNNTFDPSTGKTVTNEERRNGFRSAARDLNSDFWKDENGQSILGEAFQDASSAAQQHRAMIMELAYLAARMAEPSNRGLSDNDIKNAMRRIAGGTSNPQVMMRRFAEMTFDGAAQIEDAIDIHHGKFSDVPKEDFDKFIGGKALERYRGGLSDLQEEFGFVINDEGRAVFSAGLDNDVQPGEGIPGLETTGEAPAELSDEEFLLTL